jgi:flagellar biosynthetic protein FliR
MTDLDGFAGWMAATVLLGLRIGPALTFAPPFSLVRAPRIVRALAALGLAAVLAAGAAVPASATAADAGWLTVAAARELMLGATIALVLQLSFAALYFVGRTIDIQAGFGLAVLIDPTTRAQTPLVGGLFAYVAGMAFFAMDGHLELLRLIHASVGAIPLGQWTMPATIGPITGFASLVFILAFGAGAASMLALFLADLMIALLARTTPQMNVLVLGFQVKTIVLLLTLPISFGFGGAVLARLMRLSLQAIPDLL